MFKIRDVRQLRLLVSPVRQAILDVLEGTRDCPVAELARVLNRPADALYYHLRLMESAGLLVEKRARGERACKAYGLRRRGTVLEYQPSSKSNASAVTRIVASMLRDASRSFRRAYAPGETLRGPQRTLWAGRRMGWLTAEQVGRLNAKISQISRLLEKGTKHSPKSRLFAFTHVFCPYERTVPESLRTNKN